MTQANFARLSGCSRAAVSQAITARRVRAGPGGRVDPHDPVNVLFLQRLAVIARAKKHKAATQKGARSASPRGSAPRGGNLIERKLEADIRLKTRQAILVQLRTAERKRELVPTKVCAKWFGNLSANLRTFLTDLPARITPGLIASVEAGKSGDVQAAMEREIHDAIDRVLSQTDRDTREYLNDR